MRATDASAQTAETLILVGLILDLVGEVILVVVGLWLLAFPLLGLVVLGFALIGFVWIALVYLFSYDRVRSGDYEGARTPTLVFAVLSLVTLAVIPGILLLVAYVKLGDALAGERLPGYAWAQPASPFAPGPLPGGARFCMHCGRPNGIDNRFCQGCGAPLA